MRIGLSFATLEVDCYKDKVVFDKREDMLRTIQLEVIVTYFW